MKTLESSIIYIEAILKNKDGIAVTKKVIPALRMGVDIFEKTKPSLLKNLKKLEVVDNSVYFIRDEDFAENTVIGDSFEKTSMPMSPQEFENLENYTITASGALRSIIFKNKNGSVKFYMENPETSETDINTISVNYNLVEGFDIEKFAMILELTEALRINEERILFGQNTVYRVIDTGLYAYLKDGKNAKIESVIGDLILQTEASEYNDSMNIFEDFNKKEPRFVSSDAAFLYREGVYFGGKMVLNSSIFELLGFKDYNGLKPEFELAKNRQPSQALNLLAALLSAMNIEFTRIESAEY